MVETAEWASDIDVARAENALERAKEQLAADAPDLNRPRAEACLAVHKIVLRLRDNL